MNANAAMTQPLLLAASNWGQVAVLLVAVVVGVAVSRSLGKRTDWLNRNTIPGFVAFLTVLLAGQAILHLAGQLTVMPTWATSAWIVLSIVGAICVSRDCARQEAFEQSYVSLGVVGGLVLIAIGSLCPGLILDLTSGSRVLVGLGLVAIAVGVYFSWTDRRSEILAPSLCLVYVIVAMAVFAFRPGMFFGISSGGQATFLIAVTFVVPLSLGRLIAGWLNIEDAAFRIGVVLVALTLGVWPMASQLLIGAAEQRAYEQNRAEHVKQQEEYKVQPLIKQELEELVPGLNVIFEDAVADEAVGPVGSEPDSSQKTSE